MQNQLSFEEINKHFDTLDLSQFEKGGKNHFTQEEISKSPGTVLPKICTFYKAIKPVLLWILPVLPAKWKRIVELFISGMDQLCP